MSDFRPGVRLAVDWGEVRIGVAACDPAGTLAYPVGTVAAGAQEIPALLALVAEYEPIEVIVGLPRSMSGGEGPAAAKVRAKVAALSTALAAAAPALSVRLVDERLTTVSASRRLSASGKRIKDQRRLIDQAAAVAILEQAIELERSGGKAPGELA